MDYSRTAAGTAYVDALQSAIGARTPIIRRTRGCTGRSWIHPRLAIDFARWLDVELAVWMDGWILKIVDIIEENQPTPIASSPDLTGIDVPDAASTTTRLFRNQLVIMNEADLHCQLVAQIRRAWPSAVLIPGIGELPEAGARRLQAWKMGYTRGQPDLMILNHSGEYHGLALEFKHPGFEPSPTNEQLAFHSHLRTLGWKVLVCNDFCVALLEIDKYMRECKVPCECCGRLFGSEKQIDTHLARKRKHEDWEDSIAKGAFSEDAPSK